MTGCQMRWEGQYGDLDPGNPQENDGDISEGTASPTGDGLTLFEEYRGFEWEAKVDHLHITVPDPIYKTGAFVPLGVVRHFRTDPNRKDLFVKYIGYDPYNPSNTDGNYSPFAIGAAFDNAAIDVHALDSALAVGLGENNIDVLLVTNDLVDPYGNDDGHINWVTQRYFTSDTKGHSGIGGQILAYPTDTTYIPGITGFLFW